MLKKLFLLCKKVVLAGVLLYAYNSINLFSRGVVPINFITLMLITFFGVPGLFCLILFSFLI